MKFTIFISMNKIKVSIAMPAYNEIRFIEATLRSVVNEADEIIIGDNCSTDGTSEIIAEYAKKYPHIKHFRHKENMGSLKNFTFVLEQCTGEYIRFVGAHDLISENSTKSMLKVFDEHPDAVLVYSKKCVNIDENQNFLSISLNYDITYDSEFCRLFLSTNHHENFNYGTFYAMWPRNTIEKTKKFWVFEKSFTDFGLYFAAISIGKAYCDNESIFYATCPHNNNDKLENVSKRYQSAFNLSIYAWHFANLVECYSALKSVFEENELFFNFCLERLADLFIMPPDTAAFKEELHFIREDKKVIANDFLKKMLESKFVRKTPDNNTGLINYCKWRILNSKKIKKCIIKIKKCIIFGAGMFGRNLSLKLKSKFVRKLPNNNTDLINYYERSIPNSDKIKKYIIFGAGMFGRNLSLKFTQWEIYLDYFCDNNPKICNTRINGVKCISFDKLKKYAEEALIFVSPNNADEIYEQLERNGFKFIFPKEYISILKNEVSLC